MKIDTFTRSRRGENSGLTVEMRSIISLQFGGKMKRFLHFTALAMAVFAIAVTLPSLLLPILAVPAPILLSQNVNFKPPDVTAPDNRQNDLANPDPLARAIAYANNGIWYDTLGTVAQMLRLAPDDSGPRAEWTHLLQSQELESIANQPLVQSF